MHDHPPPYSTEPELSPLSSIAFSTASDSSLGLALDISHPQIKTAEELHQEKVDALLARIAELETEAKNYKQLYEAELNKESKGNYKALYENEKALRIQQSVTYNMMQATLTQVLAPLVSQSFAGGSNRLTVPSNLSFHRAAGTSSSTTNPLQQQPAPTGPSLKRPRTDQS